MATKELKREHTSHHITNRNEGAKNQKMNMRDAGNSRRKKKRETIENRIEY